MKKSIIAVSLASAFSLNAFAETEVQNPVWNQPTNPIVEVPVQPPIDNSPERPQPQVPTNPIEGIPTQPPVDNTPERPQPQAPTNPIEGVPTQPPVDNTPERPQPQFPTNPIEGVPSQPIEIQPEHPIQDGDYAPDISGPTEAERTSALELQFQAMAEEYNQKFNEHQEQMDGIRASLHAVTNARPFVTNGEFAVGAGVGFAGSKEAIALGGAYGISEQLSVSGTFNYETSGKYSSSDVSGGVGVQFNFK